MTTSFPLQSLLDLAQTRADDAARELGKLLAGEQRDEQRLALLLQYRDEYHSRFLAAAKNGMGRDEWRNFQTFLARLDEAIEQQQRNLSLAKQRTAAGQQSWLEERNRVKAFDALSQRHVAEQVRVLNRQEQKTTDEHAAKTYRTQTADE